MNIISYLFVNVGNCSAILCQNGAKWSFTNYLHCNDPLHFKMGPYRRVRFWPLVWKHQYIVKLRWIIEFLVAYRLDKKLNTLTNKDNMNSVVSSQVTYLVRVFTFFATAVYNYILIYFYLIENFDRVFSINFDKISIYKLIK